jgi:hypothetical protein
MPQRFRPSRSALRCSGGLGQCLVHAVQPPSRRAESGGPGCNPGRPFAARRRANRGDPMASGRCRPRVLISFRTESFPLRTCCNRQGKVRGKETP